MQNFSFTVGPCYSYRLPYCPDAWSCRDCRAFGSCKHVSCYPACCDTDYPLSRDFRGYLGVMAQVMRGSNPQRQIFPPKTRSRAPKMLQCCPRFFGKAMQSKLQWPQETQLPDLTRRMRQLEASRLALTDGSDKHRIADLERQLRGAQRSPT